MSVLVCTNALTCVCSQLLFIKMREFNCSIFCIKCNLVPPLFRDFFHRGFAVICQDGGGKLQDESVVDILRHWTSENELILWEF